ncbi:MAG: PDZ domain-containing protein, partial [Steroidobacteraceae bacterium]|nr:PDZ domain-containing protein [Steroidobacteraceae bacterium]
ELVGINSAILSRSGGNIGIGFAIPVNMARSIMDQLITYGSVKRGLLGVNIVTLTPDTAKALALPDNTQGVLVSQVTDESAAAKAGIRPGDVITAINGASIKSNTELRNAIGLSRLGEKLDVALIRDRKPLHVGAVIVDIPQTTGAGAAKKGSEAAVAGPVHPGLAGAMLADAPDGGVLIKSVEARSVASQYFRTGDRIEGANRQTIANLKELRDVATRGGALVLRVRRGNAVVLVPLRAP